MILNKDQAEAVYAAMCGLNNINGRLHAMFGEVTVRELVSGSVHVRHGNSMAAESYDSQAAFQAAYALR